MVKEIRIYVEGGGDRRRGLDAVRRGFSGLFREVIRKAQEKRIRWSIIACGSRNDAFDDFQTAITQHKDALNILLVDAEEDVHGTPWEHLLRRDRWQRPDGATDENCHLMCQCMEAWIVADVETLRVYYGQGFAENVIRGTNNVERIDKRELSDMLRRATRNTRKGEYHKINHAPDILERINVSVIRQFAPYCDRLFQTLLQKIQES